MPVSHPLQIDTVPIDSVVPHPQNPRRGDVEAIAESIRVHGFYAPAIVQRSRSRIIAGNHRWKALRALGRDTVDVVFLDISDAEALQVLLIDNKSSDDAGYDEAALAELLQSLGGDFAGTGWDESDLDALLEEMAAALDEGEDDEPGEGPVALTDDDAIPQAPADTVTRRGDLWLLGPHRLLCGDSTVPANVARAVGDLGPVTMLHADPPYGMGKEADGVLNDNLYREKLDAFQLAWWQAWLPQLAVNGSAYIWGTAPDLWRLWYSGGLGADEGLMVRNEIVWNKGSGMGMGSAGHHSYPTISERCLFLMRGEQFLGNLNTEDFPEMYAPLLSWLEAELARAEWTRADVNRITDTYMAGHWFSRSQFIPIGRNYYEQLAKEAGGRAFTKPYGELSAELFPNLFPIASSDEIDVRDLADQLRASRSFFDNAHDVMGDVWAFPRVTGEDRHGHATPKPVAMVQRAFASSSRPGDVIGVPFGGSGPEFIAAHHLDRVVVAVELSEEYCDVIARRYAEHTGITPLRVRDGGDPVPVSFTTSHADAA